MKNQVEILILDGTTISEIEAKRFIVSYQQPDPKPFDQWPDLTKEIHDRIEESNGNPKKIEYHNCKQTRNLRANWEKLCPFQLEVRL